MLPRILVDVRMTVRDENWERLARCVEPVRPEREEPYSEDELIAALEGFSGLIRLGGVIPALTRRVFAELPDLRIAGVRGDRFGTDVDLEAAGEHGVHVVDTDNIASSQPVAEYDLALMLMCLNNAGAVCRQMMAGTEKWAQTPGEGFVTGELTGCKVGLVGCGHIGQRLIELLEPFHVDLMVSDPYISDALAAALGEALVGQRPLLVASTDLSHYLTAERAAACDGAVIDHVTRFDADGLLQEFERYPAHERGRHVACGGGAAIAVMRAAAALGAREARALCHADSGDVSGDKSAVVGYLAAAMGCFDDISEVTRDV